jgi:pyrroline-5-carboxylate reductase
MTIATTLLFIGCGNMGAAIAGGALRHMPNVQVAALDHDLARAKALLPEGARIALHDDPAAFAGLAPDLTILGVKPQSFPSLGPQVMALLCRAPVVSIMAGIGLDRLAPALAPAPVARVMPNLPALAGAGMSLGCSTVALPDATQTTIEALFNAVGRFEWVKDEALLERAAPVYACGPGFVFAFAEQMILAAEAQGVPSGLAARLVQQTFLGAAKMLSGDGRGAAELKRAVSSPGGTTLAGLAVLEAEAGLPRLLPATLQAAHARALELACSAG